MRNFYFILHNSFKEEVNFFLGGVEEINKSKTLIEKCNKNDQFSKTIISFINDIEIEVDQSIFRNDFKYLYIKEYNIEQDSINLRFDKEFIELLLDEPFTTLEGNIFAFMTVEDQGSSALVIHKNILEATQHFIEFDCIIKS